MPQPNSVDVSNYFPQDLDHTKTYLFLAKVSAIGVALRVTDIVQRVDEATDVLLGERNPQLDRLGRIGRCGALVAGWCLGDRLVDRHAASIGFRQCKREKRGKDEELGDHLVCAEEFLAKRKTVSKAGDLENEVQIMLGILYDVDRLRALFLVHATHGRVVQIQIFATVRVVERMVPMRRLHAVCLFMSGDWEFGQRNCTSGNHSATLQHTEDPPGLAVHSWRDRMRTEVGA